MPIFLESTVPSISNDPGKVRPRLGLAGDPRDVGSKPFELAHDVLVAPVEVIDIVERGRALGAQGGHHESRARTDVGYGHRGTMERGRPGDDRAAALDISVCTEPAQ